MNKKLQLQETVEKHPVGRAFEELSFEEMMTIQGSGDVKPEATPLITGLLTANVTFAVSYHTTIC
ncbi:MULTISPECIES: mersacidin family lantibiotic [Bacillus cereus group]|jgi:type 2 lantibiotic (TIGR03893 family)|uniref:mersacidin family lantibiotic n=1 Tax=Bacillus cereus group TaxID=86661 RepID=UPI0002ED2A82|nr:MULTISPECIES: lichenicidin A2 family type 2 lantibiotic [Bacillus cereus group]MCU4733611.1 lichenicidin A2 family type 2 lantibiotic [Bacillus cereus]MCU5149229.1 lichenicidin A2 family type 2 lantibiotic [Bacillus cereus]MCU5496173.1 lichenicidin A2 family type 2 lantibiotic [Bacillus cereus]MCU5639336.1 lichenicidin A2 family type 2 lantibiotic [Bacillus cereus]MCU5702594.1 lichenicidin A2 family type 2 lantibiotic [Bacillus cereus]